MAEADVQPPPSQLVVVGASAGGVEALSQLVGTLPASFPAPIIIAQHLDPSRLSHLQEILARPSNLPVRTVRDREELENGVVYVIPSDRHAEVSDHTVEVHAEPGRGPPTPSIDRLLASAAEAYGEQLVAVILTGLGSDGAGGARHVKELGGTVVIQNPQTAAHPEMPLSLAPSTVDIVAELSAIGPLLNELLTGTYAPFQADDDRRLRGLLDQLRTRSGIDFSGYKDPTIRRRLQRRMLDTSNQTLEDYVRFIRRHPEEYERLANRFLIKVTDFFRDADLFTYLRENVLPGLIREARARGGELRLWSAGCATGEEAYSLAILVSELLGDQIDDVAVRIFATDLDSDAIVFARHGIYPSSAVKGVPPELRERYLTRVGSAWEVRKQLRSMVIFGHHDLAQRAPFPRIDLVLCRNVLIYFTPELQRRSIQLFAFALRESGYLVLGKSETAAPMPDHFTVVQPRLKVFRRHGQRVLLPPSQLRESSRTAVSTASFGQPAIASAEHEVGPGRGRQQGEPSAAEHATQVLLDLPLGVVIVDRSYDIQFINALARRLLGIHNPAIGEDVVHLAYRPLGERLRDAVEAAVNGEDHTIIHEQTSLPDLPGQTRFFELSAFLSRRRVERPDSPELIVLTVADVTDREHTLRGLSASLTDVEARADRLQKLLDESTRTVRDLLRANQEQASANASLRSTNEELVVGSEEVQAAMEEIETLNEEQQATNEELETLNEELQATVEELNATNEDLQARTLELQEQAARRETLMSELTDERQRLDAILGGLSDAVMMVDGNAEPVLTNPAFTQMFGERLPQVEDASGQRLPAQAHPARMAARGETFTLPFTIRAQDGSRRWFEARGEPISTGGVSGGVLLIRDVSEHSLRQLQEEFIALASHELRTPLTALHGSQQLLQRMLHDTGDARVTRYLDLGMAQTRLLEDLVQDLADVVRAQAGHLVVARVPIDLVELVQTAVDLVRPLDESQEIRLDVPAESIPVAGERRRLQQVILNLISNAMQHGQSPHGVEVRVRRDGSAAVLEVADYGAGISEEDRQHLFERFFQAGGEAGGPGLGVGLYLVHAIVSAHDGTIDVSSGNGEGTTFAVRLPLS